MLKMWRIVVLVMVLVAGSFGTVAAQGKPDHAGGGGGDNGGGPGSGETCPVAGGAQIVLDPGHGGSDPGAVNEAYGLVEKDVNLDIAYQTMGILEGQGYSVALTRYDDTGLENSQRGAIANACDAIVFVEIHLNASSDPSVNFTSNFYGKKNKDLDFAVTMNGSLSSLGIQNNGVGQFANGGLLHANMPSTLVEAVFLTNTAEAEMLAKGTRQPQIAQVIADGVMWQIGG